MLRKNLIEKFHLTALAISLAGGALKLLHFTGANVLLTIGLGSLSICYILFAFNPEIKQQKEVYINYCRNFSIAILLSGLLFYLLHWKGGTVQLLAGTIGVIISFLLPFIFPESKKEE